MTYYFQGIAPDALNLKTKETENFLLIQDILFNFFKKITILLENVNKKIPHKKNPKYDNDMLLLLIVVVLKMKNYQDEITNSFVNLEAAKFDD